MGVEIEVSDMKIISMESVETISEEKASKRHLPISGLI
jgi:hypothetical protein